MIFYVGLLNLNLTYGGLSYNIDIVKNITKRTEGYRYTEESY